MLSGVWPCSPVDALYGCIGHNILWQLVPLWDYSDAERVLATTSPTPLLVNLQSMTAFRGVTCSLTCMYSISMYSANQNLCHMQNDIRVVTIIISGYYNNHHFQLSSNKLQKCYDRLHDNYHIC